LAKTIASISNHDQLWLENCFQKSELPENHLLQETSFTHPEHGDQRLISISFREGVLFTYVPKKADANQLLEWLSQRDSVIRTLLSQRLPVLTPMVGMVADLQNSVRICAELPPEEYFQLINEIWTTLDPIFRKFYGAYGKHTGDGMVYYFFPQPDSNYLMNAIKCACEVRTTMKKISHAWALKKEWTNQLYMNIGLSEGEEWLGTFKTNTSYELVVLGETMNICGRLSDLARFGKVWATKNLVSKISAEERMTLDYGVTRTGLEEDVFVANSYAQVSSLINKDDAKSNKLMDIASCSVTEIRGLR
jgi:class 3 adenylate cyclase